MVLAASCHWESRYTPIWKGWGGMVNPSDPCSYHTLPPETSNPGPTPRARGRLAKLGSGAAARLACPAWLGLALHGTGPATPHGLQPTTTAPDSTHTHRRHMAVLNSGDRCRSPPAHTAPFTPQGHVRSSVAHRKQFRRSGALGVDVSGQTPFSAGLLACGCPVALKLCVCTEQ